MDLHFLNRRHLRGNLKAAYNVFSGGLDLDPSDLASEVILSKFRRVLVDALEESRPFQNES